MNVEETFKTYLESNKGLKSKLSSWPPIPKHCDTLQNLKIILDFAKKLQLTYLNIEKTFKTHLESNKGLKSKLENLKIILDFAKNMYKTIFAKISYISVEVLGVLKF